jgi:hypothetical protein
LHVNNNFAVSHDSSHYRVDVLGIVAYFYNNFSLRTSFYFIRFELKGAAKNLSQMKSHQRN